MLYLRFTLSSIPMKAKFCVLKSRDQFLRFLVRHNLLFLIASKVSKKKPSFALNKFDFLVTEIFSQKVHEKYYVEIGANDGVSQSNTKYLELYESWRGLLIEPIPELFVKLKKNRSKKPF